MSRIWTDRDAREAPPADRHAEARRDGERALFGALVAALVAAACVLCLAACGKSSDNNRISPIHADIQIDPPGSFPSDAIFFQRVSASGDLVVVDVMLRTSAPLTFDHIDLDLTFDPGIVNLGGNIGDPAFGGTPFCGPDANDSNIPPATICYCSASVANCCPAGSCPGPATTNPLCLNNAQQADASGELILAVSSLTTAPSYCPAATTTPGQDMRLYRLGFAAASTGSSPITFVPTAPTNNGGCGVLRNLVNLGIPCYSGNALFTASR